MKNFLSGLITNAFRLTSGGASGKVLTSDASGNGTWQDPVTGNVTGAASSTDNAIARFNGTTGKVIQSSGAFVDDNNAIRSVNGGIFAYTEVGGADISVYGFGTGAGHHGYYAEGTMASPQRANGGTLIYGFGSRPYMGSAYTPHSTAAIHMVAQEDITPTNHGTDLRLIVTPVGTTDSNRVTPLRLHAPAGTGGRMSGDYSNPVQKKRVMFQTSVADAGSSISVIPNGSATRSQYNAFDNSDPTDAGYIAIRIDGNRSQLIVNKVGAGVTKPFALEISDIERMVVTPTGEFTYRGNWSGFVEDENTWTRTGNLSFSVPGNHQTRLGKGTRLRWKQGGGYKYGVVGAAAYNGSTTTNIALIETTDFVMSSGIAVTEPAYSYQDSPQGFPDWFSYSPTVGGYSALPSNNRYKWTTSGRSITIVVRQGSSGTSNANNVTISTPINAIVDADAQWSTTVNIHNDNGSAVPTPGRAYIGTGDSTITVQKDMAGGGYTASGSKRVNFTITYEY